MDLLTKRRAHARRLFTLYNKKFFAGSLPKVHIEVEPGRCEGHAWGLTEWDSEGRVQQVSIAEDNWDQDGHNTFLKATILHECLHVKLGPDVGHESAEWREEALRLSRLGAFLETV